MNTYASLLSCLNKPTRDALRASVSAVLTSKQQGPITVKRWVELERRKEAF